MAATLPAVVFSLLYIACAGIEATCADDAICASTGDPASAAKMSLLQTGLSMHSAKQEDHVAHVSFLQSAAQLELGAQKAGPQAASEEQSRSLKDDVHHVNGIPFANERQLDDKGVAALIQDWMSPLLSTKLHVMKEFDHTMSELGLPYWIDGGSLIATARGPETMVHDDDIDLHMFAEGLPKVKAALAQTGSNRTIVEDGFWGNLPMARLKALTSNGEWKTAVDIFLREPEMDEIYDAEIGFAGTRDEVFPLRRADLNGISVWIPNKPEPILTRLYGKDWQTHVRLFDHSWTSKAQVVDLPTYKRVAQNYGFEPPSIPKSQIFTPGGQILLSVSSSSSEERRSSSSSSSYGRSGKGSGSSSSSSSSSRRGSSSSSSSSSYGRSGKGSRRRSSSSSSGGGSLKALLEGATRVFIGTEQGTRYFQADKRAACQEHACGNGDTFYGFMCQTSGSTQCVCYTTSECTNTKDTTSSWKVYQQVSKKECLDGLWPRFRKSEAGGQICA